MGKEMTKRTKKEITVAQELLQSLINYCLRQNQTGMTISELHATIATLELEKMNK